MIHLAGPPSQPGEPKIVDFDNKSVTLRWDKPKNDGGRPITHYIIQKKDKFGGWFDALITDDQNCVATIDELEARVPGLSEGKWYQFRVIAVNKAGESEPSPETKPHLCRHKNREYNVIEINRLLIHKSVQLPRPLTRVRPAPRPSAPEGPRSGRSSAGASLPRCSPGGIRCTVSSATARTSR